jgi:predicted neutral ceramidase superfamily lipid hydrolase
MLVLPTLPLAEAVPPAVLGETVVLFVAAAVLVLWVLRRLFKLLVFLALVVLIGTVLTSAVGVVEDSWTREAPTWTSSRPNSR